MKQPKPNRKPLAAVVGAGAAATLLAVVPLFEGTILYPYKDPIGILTVCTGNIADVQPGKRYTPQECRELLDKDLVRHAEGVNSCVPLSILTDGQKSAAVSFTFNVGVNGFCGSTFARKLKSQDPTACAELSRWTWAGGRELPGLVNRRKVEREMCEGKR